MAAQPDALGPKDPLEHPVRLSGEELERKLLENRETIASATPIMEQYRAMLQSSHSVIVLADPDGVILHRHGAGSSTAWGTSTWASWYGVRRGH